MNAQEWRNSIGKRIEARRLELGLSKRAAAKRAHISEVVWRQLETGERQVAPGMKVPINPERGTMAGASIALGWTFYSIEQMTEGGEPVEVEKAGDLLPDPITVEEFMTIAPTMIQGIRERLTLVEAQVSRLAALEETVAGMAKQLNDLSEETTLTDDDEGPSLGETEAGE